MRMSIQESRNRDAIRGKIGDPYNKLLHERKTFAVSCTKPEQDHLRWVKIDGLIQDLLQRGIFRKARPNLTYGQFEVCTDISAQFERLAGQHGLDVMEVRT